MNTKQRSLKGIFMALVMIFSLFGVMPSVEMEASATTSADLNISQNGIDFICSLEGFHSRCYSDYSQSSIGYGTKCNGSSVQPHASGSHSITREQAMIDMKNEIESSYIPNVRRQTSGIEMNQNQFDALVSLTYNCGGGTTKIKNSPLVKYLRGELSESDARSQYSNYIVTAGGNKLQGLVNRRNKEANLFFTPVSSSKPQNWYDKLTPVNVGTDFYAYIINTEAWKPLNNDSDNNVTMRDENGDASQVWRFYRKDDGSYKIINCQTSCALDSTYSHESGANLYTYEDSNNDAQSWYIYGESGSYYLRSKCTDCVIDIFGASTADGTNAQMFTYNGGTAQKFQIWKLDAPSSVHVHGAAGSTYTPTSIWWTEATNVKSYQLKIWKGKVWDGEAYKIIWDIKDTSYQINLPVGYYEIYVDASNNYSYTMSENVISLTVSDGEPVNIGDKVYADLIVNSAWLAVIDNNKNVELQKKESENELWCFEKQNDGSYIIQNAYTKRYLEFNNDEVKTNSYSGGNSQRWYIYGRWSGEYYLKPKNSNNVLTINSNNCKYEDNIKLKNLSWSEQQKFAIYNFDGFNVLFDANGGSCSLKSKSVKYDSTYKDLPTPTRTGYKFDGWYTDKNGGTKVTSNTKVIITSNKTLYAH